jgi:hypothetical protein
LRSVRYLLIIYCITISYDKIFLTDKPASFFVGDAAGRSTDHASSDRKLADNVGVSFSTPEVHQQREEILRNLIFFTPGVFPWRSGQKVHSPRFQRLRSEELSVDLCPLLSPQVIYSIYSTPLYTHQYPTHCHSLEFIQTQTRTHSVRWLSMCWQIIFLLSTPSTGRIQAC